MLCDCCAGRYNVTQFGELIPSFGCNLLPASFNLKTEVLVHPTNLNLRENCTA